MGYENDFVSEEVVDLEIEGYGKGDFKYKPTTAGQENDWLSEYMKIDEFGKPRQDFSVLNKLKLNNVVKVPYDLETLKKITGIDLGWENYTIDQKWLVLGKLKGKVFDKILTAINKFDEGEVLTKKD